MTKIEFFNHFINNMKSHRTFFEVILNGQLERIEWTQQDDFINDNLHTRPFGKVAQNKGESPIKSVVTFKTDGNIQGFRGDRFTGKPIDMIRKLYNQTKKYVAANQIHDVKIYDNRQLLPDGHRIILQWNQAKGTIINLLPIYSGEFDLKNVVR